MENIGLREYLALLSRRKAAYLTTAALIFFAAVAFAYLWPPLYRSTGTIQIAQPDIPANLTAPTGEDAADEIQVFADQRIQQIQQKIVDTANLIDVITKYDLYPSERKTEPLQEVVLKMQKRIKLDLVSADLANPSAVQKLTPGQLAAIAFTLSFDYRVPLTAQQVANELITRFLDEDLKQRNAQAQAESDFLAQQATQLEQQLTQQEQQVAAYRSQHAGGEEEDLPFNMQSASTTSQTIDSLTQQLAALDQQRGNLQSQLANTEPYATVVVQGQPMTSPATMLRALQFQYTTLIGHYGPDYPDVVKLRQQIQALQSSGDSSVDTADIGAQIESLRAQLAEDEKTYGANHPDVVALKRELVHLETQKATSAPQTFDQMNVKDADNPNYVMLQYQIKSIDSQYQALLEQRNDAQKQYLHYEQLIAETPTVERDYENLSRDYDNAQLRYREVKEKKLSADMNQQMEAGRQGERLEVIDSPELPLKPHFPPRGIVLAAGFVLALLGGLGGVQLTENLSGSVHGTRHVAELIGQPPLVAVPTILSKDDIAGRKRQRMVAGAAAAFLLVLVLILYNFLVTPLDVEWSVIMNRLGLS